MYLYFRYHEWEYHTTISKVVVFKQGDKVTVKIETHRPGILIGKGGVFIDGLIQRMKEETKQDIDISIKENLIWYSLYS